MTYQLLSDTGGSCGTFAAYTSALQHALHAAQTLHHTDSPPTKSTGTTSHESYKSHTR